MALKHDWSVLISLL